MQISLSVLPTQPDNPELQKPGARILMLECLTQESSTYTGVSYGKLFTISSLDSASFDGHRLKSDLRLKSRSTAEGDFDKMALKHNVLLQESSGVDSCVGTWLEG